MPAKVRIPSRNKFGAQKTTIAGVIYDSKAEAEYALELDAMKKQGIITGYERQVPFPLFAWRENGRVGVALHGVDFVVTLPDGHRECREVKGVATALWKLKHKLFLANYDIPYIVIKRGKRNGGK